jgi:predicted ABC-type ATPase
MAGPHLWLIAGPNGVGKTTYAFRHIRAVSGSVNFVNLDEIARGLSPLAPEVQRVRAARTALDLTRLFLREGVSFSLETTLAGRGHLGTIARAYAAGFDVRLLYFAVTTVDICLSRIARRVLEGGHDVPEAEVRRRFGRSIANLPTYLQRVGLWRVFDNNGHQPVVVAEGRRLHRSMAGDLTSLPRGLRSTLMSLPTCPEGSNSATPC